MITNLVVHLAVTLLTNTVETFHPSGQEKVQVCTVTEQHVLHYEWNRQSFYLTNEVFIREERRRLVMEWKEAPMTPGLRMYPPTPMR